MNLIFNTVATVSVLGTLMACAQMARSPTASSVTGAKWQTSKNGVPVRIAGAPVLPSDAFPVEAIYAQGRAVHGLGQLEQASVHYEQVLRMEPRHVGALNALGVIHAQEGRTGTALDLFARAIALAPEAAYLYNNAGYALLRADLLDEAGLALARAQQLSPENTQTQQNLALLAQARQQAAATQAVAETPAVPADIGQVLPPGARLVTVAPQIYELQASTSRQGQAVQQAKAVQAIQPGQTLQAAAQTAPPAQRQPAGEKPSAKGVTVASAAPLQPVAAVQQTPLPVGAGAGALRDTLRGVRLEVSNGVGITNLARRTAGRLASTGVITARLTNARPYRQIKTDIQFGTGQDALAKALQTRLPFAATTTATAQLSGGVQLRLVLGHDLKGRAVAAWLEGSDAQAAILSADAISAATGEGGWRWG